MKKYISSVLLLIAVDHVKLSLSAEKQRKIVEEIRHSIGAHLMAALVLEGIANEVSEVAFDSWTWKRIEKVETVLKWRMLSGLNGRKPFEPSKEPLQIVQRLQTIRNRLAHPKKEDRGEEFIIQSEGGKLQRKVSSDQKLEDGDTILGGWGKLFDEFDAKSAKQEVKRTIEAVKCLREHLGISGFEWIDNIEKKLCEATK